ncbi:MAG: CHAD domain-containing protein [Vicinamibacterales bacterium]
MVTPSQLVRRHFDDVLTHLKGAFDGDAESVHQARIATRRLREVLPLVDNEHVERAAAAVRTAGRQLGRVRELDVVGGLLLSMGDRLPHTAATELHALRQAIDQHQREARRRMVKRIERLDLPALRDAVTEDNGRSRLGKWLPRISGRVSSSWSEPIWARIVTRSQEAAAAVERTPAIYFPNRAHKARIAIKKLRYAVEIAAETGIWRPDRILKDLRKLQGILGDIHDLQVLGDFAAQPLSGEGATASDRSAISDLVDNEIIRHYAEYSRRRQWVGPLAAACTRAAAHRRWRIAPPVPVLAASMFTAPLVLEAILPDRRNDTLLTHRRDKTVTTRPASRARH